MSDRNFIAFLDNHQNPTFINIDQIRHAVLSFKDGEGSCDVMFDPDHKITIKGLGAVALYDRLVERSIALNGDPIKSRNDIEAVAVDISRIQ